MTAEAMTFETKQSPWWLIMMGGILNIVIGILLLTVPVKTVYALVLALGFYWIFAGIFTLIGMFVDHSAWGWKLFMGVISILAGITIVRYPLISALTIPAIIILMLGIQGVIVGIVGLILAFKGGGWGAGILAGLSVVFGLILIFNWTSPAMVVTLVWLAALFALFGGFVQLIRAFQQRTE